MVGGCGTKRLIVGVDPGLNCGLAILTLDGKPVLVESHRGWSLAKILERIIDVGKPTIISSDVSPAPELLRRLSKKLNAVLFEPIISMGSEEKHKLVQAYVEHYGIKVENAHEIDALAAAIKAYQHYKNKLKQVDEKLKNANEDLFPDDVKDLVIRGYSIARAIRTLKELRVPGEPAIILRASNREGWMKEIIEELTNKLMLERERGKRLRAANRELQLKIRDLEVEIKSLREALKKSRSEQIAQIRREREYQRLIEEINSLRNRISKLEAQIEIYKRTINQLQQIGDLESREGLTLLKPIEAFTREGLDKAFRLYGIKVSDIVFILDPSGGGRTTAERLAKRGVRAIILRGLMAHEALEVFERNHVPVIPADKVSIKWIDGLPYADPNEIKRIIKNGGVVKQSGEHEMLRAILEEHLREIREQK